MAEIISLDARRPHMDGEAKCAACGHRWRAVAPIGTPNLECPECATHHGVWMHPAMAQRPLWQCACGNEFFVIHDDRIMCSRCGASQHGMWDHGPPAS